MAQIPPAHKTFNENFLAQGNPGPTDYSLQNYALRTDHGAPSKEECWSQMVSSDSGKASPGGGLILIEAMPGRPAGRLVTLTCLRLYQSKMGVNSPHDKKVYAFRDEVSARGMTTSVEVKMDWFDITGTCNVPHSLDRLLECLAAEPDDETIGPFTDQEAGTKQLVTRKVAFIGGRYWHLTLGNPTVRAFTAAYIAQLQADNALDQNKGTLAYLFQALTMLDANTLPLVQVPKLPPVETDAGFLEHRQDVLEG